MDMANTHKVDLSAPLSEAAGLVGLWKGTVTHDEQTDPFSIVFADDGKVILTTPFSTGEGEWKATGERSFSYRVKEVFNNLEIMPGWININVNAVRNEDAYTGSGLCYVHAPDGSVVGSTLAHVSGRRTRGEAENGA